MFIKQKFKKLHYFICIKCNLQTFVDFNVGFRKDVKRERKKEQKEIDVIDDDDDDVMFCGKYPLHPRERLKRF